MSATQSHSPMAPRRADRSIELAYRGASAAALSRTAPADATSAPADTQEAAATPSASTANFAQRTRAASALLKKRDALTKQAAKLKQSLANLQALNLPGHQLWDRYFAQGREYRADVAYAVLGTASFVGFLVGVAGVAGAIKTARAMRETKAVLDAGGIAPQKAALEGQLADVNAQLERLEAQLNGA